MSAAEYEEALDGALRPMSTALAGITDTKNLPALSERLAGATDAAGGGADRLASLEPPKEASAEHNELLTGLHELEADLGGLVTAVDNSQLCAPSSVLARLGQSTGLAAVPAAADALAEQGFAVRFTAPKTPEEQNRRLANGTMISEPSSNDNGFIQVENGAATDAVVTLTEDGRTVLSFYIRQGANFEAEGISDGSYEVFFTTGEDWDAKTKQFTRDCNFTRFDQPLQFQTISTSTYVQYPGQQISLQPVIGGTASASDVDPGQFPTP